MYIVKNAQNSTEISSGTSGNKARELFRLQSAGLPIPRFIVLSTGFFQDFIKKTGVPYESVTEDQILSFPLDQETRDTLLEAYRSMNGVPLAVRSSADAEDTLRFSFAGIFTSVLDIRDYDRFEQAVREVWASVFSERCIAYRKIHSIRTPIGMAVIVQEMVDADYAGIYFSRDPADPDSRYAVIEYVPGTAEKLAEGSRAGERVLVRNRADLRTVGNRPLSTVLRKLIVHMKKIRKLSGPDIDVEWAVSRNHPYILQARPLRVQSRSAVHIFDNANITESYPGITMPLTFSIVSNVYFHVFSGTLAAAGIPRKKVDEALPHLKNLLGYVKGRIYYNILNWYRMIFLLPGIRYYQGFWEQMLGIRETLPDWAQSAFSFLRGGKTLSDRFNSVLLMLNAVRLYFRLPAKIKAFSAFAEGIVAKTEETLPSADSLKDCFSILSDLEESVFNKWHEPNMNDFFCFFQIGFLTSYFRKKFPEDPELLADLLAGEREMISLKPVLELVKISVLVKSDRTYLDLFNDRDDAAVYRNIGLNPAFAPLHAEILRYIGLYGHRSVCELKLESEDFFTSPELIIMHLRNYIDSDIEALLSLYSTNEERRKRAFSRLNTMLNPGVRFFVSALVRKAAMSVRDRENMRYLRTKVFSAARRLIRKMARILAAGGVIAEEQDIFYLTRQELASILDGQLVSSSLAGIVEIRKREMEVWRTVSMKDRFAVRDLFYWQDDSCIRSDEAGRTRELSGTVCARGTVSGTVLVVTDPGQLSGVKGMIVVARYTDPGWVRYFPVIAGLIIEKGSLVSHSAIVAREMNIPTVVGVQDATRIIRTGDYITLDAYTGKILIHDKCVNRGAADEPDR